MHSDLPWRMWERRVLATAHACAQVTRTLPGRAHSGDAHVLSGHVHALGMRACARVTRRLLGHAHTPGTRACALGSRAHSRDASVRTLSGHAQAPGPPPGRLRGRAPLRDTQVLPRDVGHEGLQLPRLVGAREGPAHVAGSVPDVGAHAAGSPPLLVGQCPQDHGDNWAEGAKAVSTGPRGQHLLSRRDCRQRSSDRSGHDRHARSSPSRQNSPAAQVR